MRGGKVLDRREFFWEDLGELEAATGFDTGEFFSTLLKQLYVDQPYVPRFIYVPVDFEDREALAELLSAKSEARIHIEVPQRGEKRSLIDLVGQQRAPVLSTSASACSSRAQRCSRAFCRMC